MKLPGEALLELTIKPLPSDEASRCLLAQTARFLPRGLLSLADWCAVGRMLREVRRVAEGLNAIDGAADWDPDRPPHSQVMRREWSHLDRRVGRRRIATASAARGRSCRAKHREKVG